MISVIFCMVAGIVVGVLLCDRHGVTTFADGSVMLLVVLLLFLLGVSVGGNDSVLRHIGDIACSSLFLTLGGVFGSLAAALGVFKLLRCRL